MRASYVRAVVCVSLLSASCALSQDPIAEALATFREYESRAARFDSSLADLYSEDALISTKRAGAAGDRELSFKGDKWKTMIRLGMPLAKLRGDTNRFENVSARQVGGDVVITAQRYSVLKGYWSPFTLVLRKRPDVWRIVEERSETRP